MAFGIACTACGSHLKPESKYCDNCGAAGPVIGPGFSAPALAASPFFHTPSHLAKSIFTSEASLEGERKQVTVLCSDLKGSTEYVADLDPEDARSLLDPVLERMMEAVGRYEGTVNQVMGDGIQALFGAPMAYEDHAVRACYAALKMQELIRTYAEEVRRTRGFPLLVRVGLNSGEVVVRSLGSELHMNYSAHGQAVHLAARMEQMAIPGTILMSSQTLHLAQGYVVTRSLGPMLVKGLAAPVLSYELLGAVAVSRLQALARHGLTQFVGRADEIKQLRHALDLAYARHGQIVALVGEPGVGKSRLIHEFARAPHADGWRVLQAGAVSYGSATSYLPVTEFLRSYFQLTASDDFQTIREKVTTRLMSLDETLLGGLPALLMLLDPSADEAQSPSDRPQRGQRILDAVKRLLLRESEVQPLLLVLEDLHSIDPETQALIDGLVDGLPGARIMLLVSFRPEYQHGWGGKSCFTQIRIDPLQPDVASELLDALIGVDEALGQLKDFLIEKTGGTPLFLEESVRSLVETGVLSGRPAGYHTTTSVVELKIPTTIEALLTSRIDRLSLVDKRLLQAAAVIGYEVPRSVLQAVANLRPDRLREGLKRLQDAEFLYETNLFPDIEYRFKHALVHDAAYRMLSADRRRTLHTATLIAGEQIYADRLSEKSDWLAFHAVRAQAWDRAVIHLQAAAAREIARAANRVAVQHLEGALLALDHLPSDERATLAIDLRIDLRHALTPLGRVQETLDHLNAAEQVATQLDDSARLGRIYSFTANCLVLKARYAEALTTGERALSLAGGDERMQLATKMYLARARQARGEFRAAIELFEQILAMLEEKPSDDFHGLPVLPAAFSRSSLAICCAVVGEFEKAAAYAQEAARRADAVGQPDSIMWAYWSIGSVALNKGDCGAAVLVFDRLLDVCSTHDLDAYASRIMAGLGRTMARLGQVREGLALLEKAVALDETAEPQLTRSLTLIAYVEVLLLAGEFDRALTAVTDLLRRTRSLGERGAEAHASWLAATIHAVRGADLEAGVELIEAAAVIACELDLLPLLAHCHLGRADLYRRRGLQAEADVYQDRGEKLLDQLAMKPWFTAA